MPRSAVPLAPAPIASRNAWAARNVWDEEFDVFDDEIETLLRLSSAAAREAALDELLAAIAEIAVDRAACMSAAVIVRERYRGPHCGYSQPAGGYYKACAEVALSRVRGLSPRLQAGLPLLVADTESDWSWRPLRALSRRARYRAVIALPFDGPSLSSGVLMVTAPAPQQWSERERERLVRLCSHAAKTIEMTQRRERLRDRANHLSERAERLRARRNGHLRRIADVPRRLRGAETTAGASLRLASPRAPVEQPHAHRHEPWANYRALRGLLWAHVALARQRGIELRVEVDDRRRVLHTCLSDADMVTVLGNLIDNALDAVRGLPSARRRILVRIAYQSPDIVVTVRDWGRGLPCESDAQLLRSDFSTKAGLHGGQGLALVARTLERADGSLRIGRPDVGASFEVRLPNA